MIWALGTVAGAVMRLSPLLSFLNADTDNVDAYDVFDTPPPIVTPKRAQVPL